MHFATLQHFAELGFTMAVLRWFAGLLEAVLIAECCHEAVDIAIWLQLASYPRILHIIYLQENN